MLNFHNLYETYAVDVYRFALWISGDRYEAEDITSETFVRAWARKGAIRTETLKAYLLTIARNLYLEKVRKQKRRTDLEDDYLDPSPGPESIVESQFDLRQILKILQNTPEIDRAAFIMRIQNELPYAEIARALGLSLSAAKVKVHRIRKRILVSFLDEEDNQP